MNIIAGAISGPKPTVHSISYIMKNIFVKRMLFFERNFIKAELAKKLNMR